MYRDSLTLFMLTVFFLSTVLGAQECQYHLPSFVVNVHVGSGNTSVSSSSTQENKEIPAPIPLPPPSFGMLSGLSGMAGGFLLAMATYLAISYCIYPFCAMVKSLYGGSWSCWQNDLSVESAAQLSDQELCGKIKEHMRLLYGADLPLVSLLTRSMTALEEEEKQLQRCLGWYTTVSRFYCCFLLPGGFAKIATLQQRVQRIVTIKKLLQRSVVFQGSQHDA